MTISVLDAVHGSWARGEASTRQIAAELPMPGPVSLRALAAALGQVETRVLTTAIHTSDSAPITGRGTYELRSDGGYRVHGHMRATGFYSYDYGLNLWVRLPGGEVLASVHSGSVYGTDTPGDQIDGFDVNELDAGQDPGAIPELIRNAWRTLRRANLALGHSMNAELGGVLGTAVDLVDFLARGLVFNAVLGPAGWVLVLGHETADLGIGADGQSVAGALLIAGGQLLLAGPFGLIPVLVGGMGAGAGLNLLQDVEEREMSDAEITFARRIFGHHIDYDRVVITNLSRPGENGGERPFVLPGRGGSIVMNMGSQAWQQPLSWAGSTDYYPQPGQLFVHELTHAWQYTQRSVSGMIADYADNYSYTPGGSDARLTETFWQRRSWGSFKVEQQAHIVDDWYQAQAERVTGDARRTMDLSVDLDGTEARNDPAFRFIRDHIRLGNP